MGHTLTINRKKVPMEYGKNISIINFDKYKRYVCTKKTIINDSMSFKIGDTNLEIKKFYNDI